jgi:hypothetical protein
MAPSDRALVQQVKSNPAYKEAIGTALGIEGIVATAPDLTTISPEISADVTAGGVIIGWGFAGNTDFLDAPELQVDRSDGKGFVTITTDTTPNYTDLTPFPAAPAKWTYRAIYILEDQRVGQWSTPVSVMVG